MATLARMMTIVCTEFEGKTDKGGRPYAEHCMIVAEGVRHLGDKFMMVGWGHDLVEDTRWRLDMLREEGFPEDVIYSIGLLTHLPTEPYDDYIKRIYMDEMARQVKLSDLRHNSQVSRLKGLRAKDYARLEKYCRAYVYLSA